MNSDRLSCYFKTPFFVSVKHKILGVFFCFFLVVLFLFVFEICVFLQTFNSNCISKAEDGNNEMKSMA